jgi:2-methylcitrate dehydratase PrpD
MTGTTASSNGDATNSLRAGNEVSVTTTLAEFVSNTTYDDLNPAVVDKLKELLLDIIGVASAAAAAAESSEPFLKAILDFGGPRSGTSTVFTKGHNFAPQYASLLNAAFAHTYDFDDTLAKGGLHPGSSVVPAALVQGETSGVDGKTLLTALAVGYEVICRIAVALGPGSYARGFHNTGTVGIFGAVAAIGRAKNLPSHVIDNAFGRGSASRQQDPSREHRGRTVQQLHSDSDRVAIWQPSGLERL